MMADDRIAERRINLAALKKQDQSAENILDTASSVAHYKFDAAAEKWEKTEFEGSMFLYSRGNEACKVAFLVMNRLRKENLVVEIKPGMEFKLQEPFLLCRTSSDIIGIWFYDVNDCNRISSLLSRIAACIDNEKELSSLISRITASIEQREAPRQDIMKLFMKAKEDYDKKEKIDNDVSKSESSTSILKLASEEQKAPSGLKGSNSNTDTAEGEEDGIMMKTNRQSNPLMKLLNPEKTRDKKPRSRTLSYGDRTNPNRSEYSEKAPNQSADDFFQSESNRNVNDGSTTVQDDIKSKVIDVAMLEANVLMNSPTNKKTKIAENSGNGIEKTTQGTLSSLSTQTSGTMTNVTPSKSAATRTSLIGMGRGRGLATILNATEKTSDDRPPLQACNTTPSRVQQGESSRNSTPKKETGLAMKFPDPPSSNSLSSLMSPMQFKAAQKNPIRSADSFSSLEMSYLSKQQFQDALLEMIQNDDTFVDRLHNCYLNMVNRSNR